MATSCRQRFALSTYDNRWQEFFCSSRCVEDRKSYLAVRVFLLSGLRCDGERYIYETLNWKKIDQTTLMAAVILLVVCPIVYCGFVVCCRCRTRKVETDDLNRRASAMSIELVRRRSSINYDNLPVNRV